MYGKHCKDCINCDMCSKHKYYDDILTGDNRVKIYDEEPACIYFIDKSKFIKLPCNVGDTIYYFCETFGDILDYKIEAIHISCEFDDRKGISYEALCSGDGELLDDIDFDVEDIGDIVFLTKAEAEKALKERKSE